jgi:hypothetical protein
MGIVGRLLARPFATGGRAVAETQIVVAERRMA